MKRISFVLFTVIIIVFVCVSAYASDVIASENTSSSKWILTSDGILTITDASPEKNYKSNRLPSWNQYADSITEIKITYDVKVLGNYAFYNCKNAEKISIPSSITSIGDYAFANCSSITDINIPSGVTSIGVGSFSQCYGLKSAVIPQGVIEIKDNTFKRCLTIESVVIPEGVTSIGLDAFYRCEKLKEINLPSTLEYIGERAFENCTAITELVIPEGVKKLDKRAFCYCPSLSSVTIPSTLNYFESGAFRYCDSISEVYISDIVSWIGSEFNTYTSTPLREGVTLYVKGEPITELIIPESVTEITDLAFYQCKQLTSVVFPENLTAIGNSAFSGCTNVIADDLYLENIQTMGVAALKFKRLSLTLGDSVKSYEPSSASATESFNLYAKSTSDTAALLRRNEIDYMPYDLKELVRLEVISSPERKYLINDKMVDDPELKITAIYSNKTSEDVTKIAAVTPKVFDEEGAVTVNVIYSDETGRVITKLDVTVIAPRGSIGDNIYWEYVANKTLRLSGSGKLPDYLDVNEIPWIKYANKIENFIIEDGITELGNYSLSNLRALKKLNIPSTVSFISRTAFCGADSLECIEVDEDNPCFCQIEAVLYSKDKTELVLFPAKNEHTYLDLPEELDTIRANAFCKSEVRAVSFPQKITIEDNAFYECKNLSEVYFYDEVVSIGGNAFYGCSHLEKVIFKKSLRVLGEGAFSRCMKLEYIILPSPLSELSENAFKSCYSLKGINLPDTLKRVGASAFENCFELRHILIPDGVTEIGEKAFSKCISLQTVKLGGLIPDKSLFKDCKSLTHIIAENSFGIDKTYTTAALKGFVKKMDYKDGVFRDCKRTDWFYSNIVFSYEIGIMMGVSNTYFSPKSNITLAQLVTMMARLHSIYYTGSADFVQGDIWYKVYLDYLNSNGVITEYDDLGLYATRRQFIDIARSLPGCELDVINLEFEIPDVENVEENESVYALYRAGILSGSDDEHTFNSNSNITRAEVAAILSRMIDKNLRIKF